MDFGEIPSHFKTIKKVFHHLQIKNIISNYMNNKRLCLVNTKILRQNRAIR